MSGHNMPTLTREDLYERVWAEPVRTVAAEFGVSDVWLKKVCTAAHIPVPDRGHWAKLRAGKPVSRVKLPLRRPGEDETLAVGTTPSSWPWNPEAELKEELPPSPAFAEALQAVQARIEKELGKLPRSRDLDTPAVPIRKLLEEDEKRRARQAASSYPWASDDPLFDSPFERRRLRLLNAVAFGLAKVGCRLIVHGKPARELVAQVGSQSVAFLLDHPAAKPDRWNQWSARKGAVDTLKLELRPRFGDGIPVRVWQDTGAVKLEAKLSEIVLAIIVAGEAEYRSGRVSHHAYLIKRRAENEVEVERRRLEAERLAREKREAEAKARRELLSTQAAAWRTAKDIRGFVSDVLSSAGDPPPGHLARWAEWARAEADSIDPQKQGALTAPQNHD